MKSRMLNLVLLAGALFIAVGESPPAFALGPRRMQQVEEIAKMPVHPSFIPVSGPWRRALSEEVTLMYETRVYSKYEVPEGTAPSAWQWEGRLLESYIVGPRDKLDILSIIAVPKHIRVKRDEYGKPMIETERKGLFRMKVGVDVEIGIFGVAAEELHRVERQTGTRFVSLPDLRISLIPQGPDRSPETGEPLCDQRRSKECRKSLLIRNYQQTKALYLNAGPTEDGWPMWEAHLEIELNRKGANLFRPALREGQFTLPLLARMTIPVLIAGKESAGAPAGALRTDNRIPVAHASTALSLPGGVACVSRNWLGRVKPSEKADCSNYWTERR